MDNISIIDFYFNNKIILNYSIKNLYGMKQYNFNNEWNNEYINVFIDIIVDISKFKTKISLF